MPPIRSDFPDYGPNSDFFVETGPEMVRIVFKKSDFISKQLILRRTAHVLLWHRHNCRVGRVHLHSSDELLIREG